MRGVHLEEVKMQLGRVVEGWKSRCTLGETMRWADDLVAVAW